MMKHSSHRHAVALLSLLAATASCKSVRSNVTQSAPSVEGLSNSEPAAAPMGTPTVVAESPRPQLAAPPVTAVPMTTTATTAPTTPSAARRSGRAGGGGGEMVGASLGALGGGPGGDGAETRRARRTASDRGSATRESPSIAAPPHGGESDSIAAPQQQQAMAQLTAASVADVDRRDNYLDYLTRHAGEAAAFGQLDMSSRVRFRVVDGQGRGVGDARIAFTVGAQRVEGRTHADGGWDFFPSAERIQGGGGAQGVTASWHGQVTEGSFRIPARGDAQETITLRLAQATSERPRVLDLGFLVDITGSMEDELRYVNAEIATIVRRIELGSPGVTVRVGATFYRDRTDDQLIEQLPFTSDVAAFTRSMRRIAASGGGDYPEDLDSGLDAAMNRMQWSDGDAARVLVVVADAPPQNYGEAQYHWHNAMRDASKRGIRLLPVAASGADRRVEFLFRAMGSYTSTPYVYLTDDSGVGGTHMEADTDRVAVEHFSDLLTRVVISDLRGDGMHEPIPTSRR